MYFKKNTNYTADTREINNYLVSWILQESKVGNRDMGLLIVLQMWPEVVVVLSKSELRYNEKEKLAASHDQILP